MDSSLRRVVVTGGAGFIGSRLVRKLVADYDVTVFDNLSVGRRENVPPSARLVVGDILDPDALAAALDGADAIVHLAARVAIRSSFEFVVQDTMTNVVGTASVMRAAGLVGTVKRAVTASSMAVYADSVDPRPVPESHPCQPASPYGISKLAAEQLTHAMARAAGMSSLVLRLFNTYGPGQALSPYVGVATIFVNRLSRGEAPIIYGDGEQCRDFVHVDDVADAFFRALKSPASGDTLNVGTGRPTSVNALLALLQRVLGTRIAPQHRPAVIGELRYSIAEISRAREILGYQPRHEIAAAMPRVVEEIAAGVDA